MRLGAVVAGAALALAACSSSGGGNTNTSAPAGGGPTTGGATSSTSGNHSNVKVGMAYDVGGRGDKSFNDLAAAGLDKAKSQLGVQVKELAATNGETEAAKESRLTLLASSGYNPIVAVGFAYATAVGKVVPKFPKTHFAIIDDDTNCGNGGKAQPNVECLMFHEEQSSYLVGVAAALATKNKNVGFIGGVDVPLIQKFQAGYQAGVHSVDKSIKIQVKYLTEPPDFGGFNDPTKGKTAALGMYAAGADPDRVRLRLGCAVTTVIGSNRWRESGALACGFARASRWELPGKGPERLSDHHGAVTLHGVAVLWRATLVVDPREAS
jgi:basic membrane protein A